MIEYSSRTGSRSIRRPSRGDGAGSEVTAEALWNPQRAFTLVKFPEPTLGLEREDRRAAGGDAKRTDKSPLPVYADKEEKSDLYVRPQPVSIEGYDGSAMEPFISPDGHYLFFNNENDPAVNTNLHFAERIGKLSFRYLGELPGVNSHVLDAAPSLD